VSRTPQRIAARERARSRQYGVTGALSASRVARGKLAAARTSGRQPDLRALKQNARRRWPTGATCLFWLFPKPDVFSQVNRKR